MVSAQEEQEEEEYEEAEEAEEDEEDEGDEDDEEDEEDEDGYGQEEGGEEDEEAYEQEAPDAPMHVLSMPRRAAAAAAAAAAEEEEEDEWKQPSHNRLPHHPNFRAASQSGAGRTGPTVSDQWRAHAEAAVVQQQRQQLPHHQPAPQHFLANPVTLGENVSGYGTNGNGTNGYYVTEPESDRPQSDLGALTLEGAPVRYLAVVGPHTG